MTLGDRCDEIVRLIDETLGAVTTPVPPRRRHSTVGTTGAVARPTVCGGRTDTVASSSDIGPAAA